MWIAREWDSANNYAKRLRSNGYFKVIIPCDTLHREIHHEMACVPVPGRNYCAKAYNLLVLGFREGKLHEDDSVLDRLDFLLNVFTLDECPRTYLALLKEYEIFRKYYASMSQESL